MRLATRYDEIHAAGAELVAVSVNEDERQAGMAARWGLSHTRMVSDPGGETYLKALDLYDPVERDGIALPGMVIIDPDGNEVYRYQGRDFADRTNDDDLFEALAGLGLPAVDPGPWTADVEASDELRGYFRAKDYGAYFRGNMFGAIAIAGRVEDPASKAMAKEHAAMSRSSNEAWDTWRKANNLA